MSSFAVTLLTSSCCYMLCNCSVFIDFAMHFGLAITVSLQTDRAAMLDEIVDYVKFLRLQVKVL